MIFGAHLAHVARYGLEQRLWDIGNTVKPIEEWEAAQ
jgi:hypothetical protein